MRSSYMEKKIKSYPKPKHPGGRPTRYKKEYCDALIKYFNREPYFETPVITTYKDGSTKEEVKLIPADLPTLAGFAVSIGVHRETLNNWANEKKKNKYGEETNELLHPEFFDAFKRAKDYQENILVINGIQGNYNPAFAIFTAKNIIGWRDRSETDVTSGGEKLEFVIGRDTKEHAKTS